MVCALTTPQWQCWDIRRTMDGKFIEWTIHPISVSCNNMLPFKLQCSFFFIYLPYHDLFCVPFFRQTIECLVFFFQGRNLGGNFMKKLFNPSINNIGRESSLHSSELVSSPFVWTIKFLHYWLWERHLVCTFMQVATY